MTDPTAPRTVEPHGQYAGATQINVDGRCFQVAGVGPEAVAMPDYGRRWPERQED